MGTRGELGYEARKKPKKPWVTDQMIDKMEERQMEEREYRTWQTAQYRKMNNRARAVWWQGQCRELEELDRSGRSDLVYAKIREIHQKDRGGKKQGNVVSKDGTLLTDSENVKERWREYIEELYEKPPIVPLETEEEVDIDSIGPDLLRKEVIKAMQHLN